MKITIKDKKELLDLASNFSDFVKSHKWISRYDVESDAFSATVPKLSQNARIRYFDDEVAFYVSKNEKVEGLFIEYFKSNFIKHHRNLKNVLKDIEKTKNKKTLVELNQKKIKKIAPDLENAIKLSLAEKLDFSLRV